MKIFQLIGDIMWYAGHILCGISILITSANFWAGVAFVLAGQGLTMLSRPIGRLNNNIKRNKKEKKPVIDSNHKINISPSDNPNDKSIV